MASPFPGMDPYLEQPAFWSSFHTRFMVAIADALDAQLFPRYYVDVETRTYIDDDDSEILVGIPDGLVLATGEAAAQPELDVQPLTGANVAVATQAEPIVLPMPEEVRERYLEIRDVATKETITVIELLSPKNKQAGMGRMAYLRKRNQVLASLTHLIELDLLRANRSMPWSGGTLKDYHIVVSRSEERPGAELYSFSIPEMIPTILLPLKSSESVALELQAVFAGVMERAHYGARIDYSQALPAPKPSPEVQTWIEQRLASCL